MKKILMLIVFFVSFTQVWGTTITINDKNSWLQYLQAKNYNALEIELSKLQQNYENDASTERILLFALSSFENSDPILESELEAWVLEKPDSVFSHLSLGLYHAHLGWLSRGSRWSKDTTSQQFAKMRGHFRKASDELTWVVNKNPKQSIAYAGLISIERGISIRNQKNSFFDKAIKHNPLSSVVRTTYLSGLLPKWGGSFDEIEKFLSETSTFYSQNSALKIQDGYLEYAKGDKLFTSDSINANEDALVYLNKAIVKSSYTKYLSRRAQVHKSMKSYYKSIDDYTKALQKNPQDSTDLAGRANVYYKLKKYDLALENATSSLLYDKMDPRALQTRGFIYYVTKKRDKALIDLLDSLVYGFEKKATHKYIGYIYYYNKKNYRLAAESLKVSSDLGNDDSYIWYLITASQWHNRDCEFVKSADIYAQKCKDSGDCKKKDLDWALKSATFAKRSTCKQ